MVNEIGIADKTTLDAVKSLVEGLANYIFIRSSNTLMTSDDTEEYSDPNVAYSSVSKAFGINIPGSLKLCFEYHASEAANNFSVKIFINNVLKTTVIAAGAVSPDTYTGYEVVVNELVAGDILTLKAESAAGITPRNVYLRNVRLKYDMVFANAANSSEVL